MPVTSSRAGRRNLGWKPKVIGLPQAQWERSLQDFIDKLWQSEADGVPPGYKGTDPTTVAIPSTADPGTQTAGWAAADHAHAGGTPAAAVDLGAAGASGTGTRPAREDHVHKRAVEVTSSGVAVGTRRILNIIGATCSDDSGNDRVTVSISGGSAEEAELLAWMGL